MATKTVKRTTKKAGVLIRKNAKGKKEAILPFSLYKKLLEQAEELEDIRAYDKAKKSRGDFIPLEEVKKQIGL